MAKTVEMLVHSITAAENAHANAAPFTSGTAQASLLTPSKGGRPRLYSANERRQRNNERSVRTRKRKKEAHAALEVRAQKAEGEQVRVGFTAKSKSCSIIIQECRFQIVKYT